MSSSILNHAIVITGCIGSGKSTAVSFLMLYGYDCVCADKIAHSVLIAQKSSVVEAFGEGILNAQGEIERKKLGEIVFANPQKREILESILHSHIRDEIIKQALVLEKKQVWYFLDIPLFFEVGGKDTYPVKRSVVIYASLEESLRRIMQRDRLSMAEAQARLNAQMPIEQKCALADDVIDNSQDIKLLQRQVESYLQSLPKFH